MRAITSEGRLPTWDQYATRWTALHGGIDPRRTRPSVRRRLRIAYAFAKIAARLRMTPGMITGAVLIADVLVPIVAVLGSEGALLAVLLVLVAAVSGTVGGALAVVTSHATRLGYVYDSVVDRVGEVCWLLAFWRLGAPAPIVVAAGALTWLHEYARTRASAAGMTNAAPTTGERLTRILIAAAGYALAALFGLVSGAMAASVVTFVAVIWLVLAVVGVMQLFAAIHRTLTGRAWPQWTPLPAIPVPAEALEEADDHHARHAVMPPSVAIYMSSAVPENDNRL